MYYRIEESYYIGSHYNQHGNLHVLVPERTIRTGEWSGLCLQTLHQSLLVWALSPITQGSNYPHNKGGCQDL